MGEVHVNGTAKLNSKANSNGIAALGSNNHRGLWFEEEIEDDLRWVFSVSRVLHTGISEFQDIALVESGPFGKVLILDGKLQSAEADEFVYHECLVHPALLYHPNPRNVFIMGGGEGSTAREALRHKSVKKVVMCDIDKEVVEFCRAHLTMNHEAFHSSRLDLVINDARAELEERQDKFDIIIGDLADPVEGGPCYKLYTQSFYERVVKPRLNAGGILVTQGGPAGILTHSEVYSSIFNTLRQVFKYVVPYAAHIPSYSDSWGWIMASDHPFAQVSVQETDSRIKQRFDSELRFLDGETLSATLALNKHVRQTLAGETHVYTEESARFVHGHGAAHSAQS
ncbi:thermospermine synthase ACAULIS5 [Selaginella moellendorffii]|uniref:thermospermine synthase ACAULIS5 n=1 Tax=Selaginella moellendorffii TaxID=88036 RepID=UPI000D1CCCBB|nr:thermospermine synthase ACAULIS5 [Selaginella moellendorffii]|eukprot:XP_024544191.1 thermospermine synthase ACAULIS5 [Selaginella moellendorffii]